MERNASRIGLLLLVMTALFMVGFSKPGDTRKATWIWQAERIEDEPEKLIDFAKKNHINVMYLHVDMRVPEAAYRRFLRQAGQAGIEVHGLAGHPLWALREYRDRIMKLVDWVSAYNQSSAAAERFKGIHLDVEPYVLPEWEVDPQPVLRSWTENMEHVIDAVKGRGSLEISVDMPVWFDNIMVPNTQSTSLSEWIISRFDHVTLMAYRQQLDGGNGIIELVQNEMEIADRFGKSIFIGVNTKPMTETHTTFYDAGIQAMDAALKQVSERLEHHASFTGVAIHDYQYWNRMLERDGDAGGLPDPKPDPEPLPKPNPDPGQISVPMPPPMERNSTVVGTYVWQAELAINQPDDIIAFAKEKGINYLYVRLDLQQPFDAYRSFVKKAQDAGIEMHAMGGHPAWALTENRQRIMKLVDYVKRYNQAVAPEERFYGIHLDVEPYVLPEWSSSRDDVVAQWRENMNVFAQSVKADSKLEISVDLAVWLDRTFLPDKPELSISEWMIGHMDHVTLMAFRNMAEGSNGIVAVVKQEMQMADRLGKRIVVAVEMKESFEGEHISFYDKGAEEMIKQLDKLPEMLAEHSSYTGFMIHAYDYWKEARP
ncbi:hypothetical protein M5X06_25680 [Paenibacillus alvei]|uniref:Glycoside hydrolase family 42 N-terminal domain-containing protein n=1 Tax=Paenibacillus alvei TaxID=44250 RepID=A0ABT4H145_PAEAL|nr:hypothetical protein [Paenibacillus alvei]MCY9762700.1 hypothetical protein [Paenibacillus alvei]MCY9770179.1 hypothetical protein [Paenibacillus alvei]